MTVMLPVAMQSDLLGKRVEVRQFMHKWVDNQAVNSENCAAVGVVRAIGMVPGDSRGCWIVVIEAEPDPVRADGNTHTDWDSIATTRSGFLRTFRIGSPEYEAAEFAVRVLDSSTIDAMHRLHDLARKDSELTQVSIAVLAAANRTLIEDVNELRARIAAIEPKPE